MDDGQPDDGEAIGDPEVLALSDVVEVLPVKCLRQVEEEREADGGHPEYHPEKGFKVLEKKNGGLLIAYLLHLISLLCLL